MIPGLATLNRAPFMIADMMRQAQGNAIGAFGLGPKECPYQTMASGAHWRVRDYGGKPASPALLIVAAPIKRPYIWDLAPSVSAIGRLLREGFHVYLLEWMQASDRTQNGGLGEHCDAISEGVAAVTREASGKRPYLAGHSLGGTLAAIFTALEPASIGALVLLGAPLCFEPGAGTFRDALVALLPADVPDVDSFPGSLLSCMAAMAAPGTFIWSRLMDAVLSAKDSQALEIHGRVERWSLDEVALPGKLVHHILQWLFRENRFCREKLQVRGRVVGPSRISVPTLAVVNTADEIAPVATMKPCIDAMPIKDACILEYPGEAGVGGCARADDKRCDLSLRKRFPVRLCFIPRVLF